ncbi:MAG: YqeG family HAD IIIA-type phosphatase [Firmicutes bacterium]|nr:YqeG family HAD IIIA-type phosphatase [Bacillota bacterium]
MGEHCLLSFFSRKLNPSLQVGRIFEISQEDLLRRDIKGLIVDLDNTLTEWGRDAMAEETLDWLRQAQDNGFGICMLSNNRGDRLARIAETLNIAFIEGASKPRRRGFRQAIELLQVEPERIAVIGDQVFTDVLGGNRLGLYTILVSPMSSREFIGTRLVRIPERAVLGALKRSKRKG